MMKRSLALGALMAFVITGSAMAGSIGTTTINGEAVTVNPSGEFTVGADGDVVNITKEGNSISVIDENDVANILGKDITLECTSTSNGRAIQVAYGATTNIGNKNTETVMITSTGSHSIINIGGNVNVDGKNINIVSSKGKAIEVNSKGNLTIGSDITEKVSVTSSGDMGIFVAEPNCKAVISSKVFTVVMSGEKEEQYAIHVRNTTQTEIAPDKASSLDIVADKIYISNESKGGLGLSAFSNGQLNVSGDLVVNADHAIDTRGYATINVNTDGKHSTVLNGDIVFETPNTPEDPQDSGNLINSYVNVNLNGEGSSWTGKSYLYYQKQDENGKWNYVVDSTLGSKGDYYGEVTGFKLDIANGASWNVTGDSFANTVNLKEGGSVNIGDKVSEMNVTEVNMTGGTINMNGQAQTMSVNNLVGDDGTINVSNSENKVSIVEKNEVKSLTVGATTEYSKELAKGDIADGLQNLADQVKDNTTAGAGKSAADNVAMAETGVVGETTAKVDKDGNVIVASIDEKVNSSNAGIAQMGSVALMTWRQENNDMNKRLGELRNSKGEHGIWTRMTRGESDFEGIKNQYNAYQIGYDEKLSNDKTWTVGAALTYTEGKSSFAEGSGENTHKGFAVYGSKLNEDGSFIDLIAKYARLDHEFDALGGAGNGEYDTNGYSVSAEYGKRFEKGNGFWVEPQVELTYGKIGSASYKTSEGVTVAQDGMDSLVGRVGFSLGKDIKDGNVYVRASYLYDFDGETSMSFSDGYKSRTIEQDLGGGWFEVGVGTNYNLSDATYLYFDVEKTYGGDVATPWQWNAGVRYSF